VQFVSNVVFASVVLKEQVCHGMRLGVYCLLVNLGLHIQKRTGNPCSKQAVSAFPSAAALVQHLPPQPASPHQVTRGVLAATACIVVGCVLLVSFGDHSSRVYTAHDLLGLYAQ
jgi:hypothetical protein